MIKSQSSHLHCSWWTDIPTQLCFIAMTNLIYSLITCFTASSLSAHRWHSLFCCVLSILTFVKLFLNWYLKVLLLIISYHFDKIFFGTIIIIISLLVSFSHLHQLVVFHWRLNYSKSPQVSRTLLSILADFNNAVIWLISIFPLISNSSSLIIIIIIYFFSSFPHQC